MSNPKSSDIRPSVVIVTMDTHLNSAAAKAREGLSRTMPEVMFNIHSASEYTNDARKLERCKEDIAKAQVVIVSMLFLEDHFLPIMADLQARRETCKAMVCIMSASEVVKLTRMGRLDMGKPTSGPMALLKKLRGKSDDTKKVSAGAKQMKLLRQLPKFLRFVPGTAQDLRAYFLTMQYWLAGSQENILNLVMYLADRYIDQAHPSKHTTIEMPMDYPDVGVYHPRMRGRFAQSIHDLPMVVRKDKARGRVGLLMLRSYLIASNALHYDAVIAALEVQGLQVVPAFASGLDSRPAIEAFFMKDGQCTVDAVVSLTGFSLVGGPAYNDARAAEEILAKLDVPYIAAHPVEFQTLDQWGGSDRGLMPVESTIMVAIPELDGSVVPMVYAGRPGPEGVTCTGCQQRCTFTKEHKTEDMFTCTERTAMLAMRVSKLVDLRRSERAQRKVAMVLFNFPPNAGNTGTAAFLAVFESLYNLMLTMKEGGYQVDMPESVEALQQAILHGNAKQYGADANVHTLINAQDHVRRERWLSEIEAQWGPAPGKQLSNGSSIFVLGHQFGNVLVTVQPSFGYEGDPMRLLFEKGFAPTHAFSAFYRYVREDFGAHAVLHFGTHGALEFMPGKQAGLSGSCWPDRLIGDLPNFYLYAANNPSEGAIAKRRSGATLISYLTPTIENAGLYSGLVELKTSISRWQSLGREENDERARMVPLIQAQAALVDLASAEPAWCLNDAPSDALNAALCIQKLSVQMLELEYTLIPHGLHVVGRPLSHDALVDMACAMALAESHIAPERAAMVMLVNGTPVREVLAASGLPDTTEMFALVDKLALSIRLMRLNSEVEGLLAALDGRYILPAPGGDILRNADILPTGRNLHGFDPFKIPSAFAVQDGAQQADKLIARYLQDGHELPESVAIVLWGSDNLKSEGSQIGQALRLMGAQPRFDSYGRLVGAQLMPLELLGRPRIDVVVTLSGIFRDLLPLQIKMLAEAAYLAATAKESEQDNFVRKHALAYQAQHGCDMATASLRVFGNADGAYGSNVNNLVENGLWSDESELANTYTSRKGFAFGMTGQPVAQNALLKSALADVALTYQNLESVELGVTTVDNYFDTLGGITRAVQQAKGTHEEVPVYIGDQTRGDGQVRSLSEQVSLETRTRMLNPKWYESLLEHGYEGVRQIEVHITNTMGWSATTGQVQPWVYKQLTEKFMLDPQMRERLASLNPTASARLANRLMEASTRAYWTPDAQMLERMKMASEELEDRLEGVVEGRMA
jgi:magnesium chelatase subunit H